MVAFFMRHCEDEGRGNLIQIRRIILLNDSIFKFIYLGVTLEETEERFMKHSASGRAFRYIFFSYTPASLRT